MTQKQNFARFPGYILFAIVGDPSAKPGWDILDIIIADCIESCVEDIGVAPGLPSTYSGSWSQPPAAVSGERKFVVRKAQFLMGQKETNLVTEYNEKLKEHMTKAANAVKVMDEVAKKLATAESDITYLKAEALRTFNERQTIVDTKNKLEANMAKLRKMLGEKTINDILNPPEGKDIW